VKKITAIFLLFCLVFASAGYHFVFRFQIMQAKQEMKKQLKTSDRHKEDITKFKFTGDKLDQLEWENENEFRFNGHMYDVISKHQENGSVDIRCIADEKETALLDQYMKINRSNIPGKKALNSLIQLICAQFLPPSEPTLNYFPSLPTKFPTHISGLFSMAYPIQTPPPRHC
jgi:hypothetical protein